MNKIKHSLNLPVDWFVDDIEDNMYDVERQSYILRHKILKLQKKVKNNDIDSYIELLFHALNINCLLDNKAIFDEYHDVIKQKKIVDLYKHISSEDKYSVKFNIIVQDFKNLIIEYINDIMPKMVEFLDKINIVLKNNKIHTKDTIYFIIHSKRGISIYKNKYSSTYPLGNYIRKIADLKSNDPVSDYSEFINNYNKNNEDNKILSDNIIAVDCISRISDINVYKLIRNIIITNKWFNSSSSFKPDIMSQLFDNINSFDYKFSI